MRTPSRNSWACSADSCLSKFASSLDILLGREKLHLLAYFTYIHTPTSWTIWLLAQTVLEHCLKLSIHFFHFLISLLFHLEWRFTTSQLHRALCFQSRASSFGRIISTSPIGSLTLLPIGFTSQHDLYGLMKTAIMSILLPQHLSGLTSTYQPFPHIQKAICHFHYRADRDVAWYDRIEKKYMLSHYQVLCFPLVIR